MTTHFYCISCNVVVPIFPICMEVATEVAKHVGHVCKYTRIVA